MAELKYIETTECADVPEIRWAELRKLMELRDLSYPTLARMSGTPESTLRKLLQGVTKDPRISTMYPVVRALGASFDHLLDLVPKRDRGKEESAHDAAVMDAMRIRMDEMMADRAAAISSNAGKIDELNKKIDEQVSRLEYKAGKIKEQEIEITRLQTIVNARDTTVRNLESLVKRQRNELWYMRVTTLALVTAIILVIGYFAWEIGNLDQGVTSWLYPELRK